MPLIAVDVVSIPLYVPAAIPAIVTLFDVPCIPWLGWNTLITPELLVVLKGLFLSVLVGKVSLVSVTVPVTLLNSALLNLNFISSFCSADQVIPFCDLNNTPAYGWADIVLLESNDVSPILAT